MTDPTERKSRRRRSSMILGAIVLLTILSGALTVLSTAPPDQWRNVDIVRAAGFIVLSLVLAVRATTAFSLIGRNPALDDELTRANRAAASRIGFWTMVIVAIISWISTAFESISVGQAVPVIITAGVVSAAISFAVFEGRGNG
jgi:apolipoprotein N-acyltransferase